MPNQTLSQVALFFGASALGLALIPGLILTDTEKVVPKGPAAEYDVMITREFSAARRVFQIGACASAAVGLVIGLVAWARERSPQLAIVSLALCALTVSYYWLWPGAAALGVLLLAALGSTLRSQRGV